MQSSSHNSGCEDTLGQGLQTMDEGKRTSNLSAYVVACTLLSKGGACALLSKHISEIHS
jgi:hypothetical protein